MHFIKHKQRTRTLKRTSFLYLVLRLHTISFISILAVIGFTQNKSLILPTIIVAGSCLLTLVLFFASKKRCGCQLCQAPIFTKQKCNMNKNAKTLFGSYRAKAATSILLLNNFRCPYCGESFSCSPREEKPVETTTPTKRRAATMRNSGGIPQKRSH